MSEFDSIVVCDTVDERKELVKTLRDFRGYEIKEESRDWVNMSFTGKRKEGEWLPLDYMNLHDFLVMNGFVEGRSYWGARRFEKRKVESTKSEGIKAVEAKAQ